MISSNKSELIRPSSVLQIEQPSTDSISDSIITFNNINSSFNSFLVPLVFYRDDFDHRKSLCLSLKPSTLGPLWIN